MSFNPFAHPSDTSSPQSFEEKFPSFEQSPLKSSSKQFIPENNQKVETFDRPVIKKRQKILEFSQPKKVEEIPSKSSPFLDVPHKSCLKNSEAAGKKDLVLNTESENLTRNNLSRLDVEKCSKMAKDAKVTTDRLSDDGKSDLSTEIESPKL